MSSLLSAEEKKQLVRKQSEMSIETGHAPSWAPYFANLDHPFGSMWTLISYTRQILTQWLEKHARTLVSCCRSFFLIFPQKCLLCYDSRPLPIVKAYQFSTYWQWPNECFNTANIWCLKSLHIFSPKSEKPDGIDILWSLEPKKRKEKV